MNFLLEKKNFHAANFKSLNKRLRDKTSMKVQITVAGQSTGFTFDELESNGEWGNFAQLKYNDGE